MNNSLLIAGSATLMVTIVCCYLFIILVFNSFKSKHFPKAQPNLSQSLVLTGKIMAGLILISAVFTPIRDFLFVLSTGTGSLNASAWSFLLLCGCVICLTFIVASVLENLVSKTVFKGQSLAVELQENNLGVAIFRMVLIAGLAYTMVFGMGMIMQSFIPMPAIPTIR